MCHVSVFQFARYFTLLRRLTESQFLLEDGPSATHQTKGLRAPSHTGMLPLRPQEDEMDSPLLAGDALLSKKTNAQQDALSLESYPCLVESNRIASECSICMDRPEDSVMTCCSHAICHGCEKRWVRRRLRCPFCRQSFSSVKQAVNTQWELMSDSPVSVEHIRKDIRCLEDHMYQFWQKARAGEQDDSKLASFLSENYTERLRKVETLPPDDTDGFVVVQELSAIVV